MLRMKIASSAPSKGLNPLMLNLPIKKKSFAVAFIRLAKHM